MSEIWTIVVLLGAMFLLLGSGVWVAFSLILVGVIGFILFTNAPVGLVLATTLWGKSYSYALSSLPLFILMGEILIRSKLSQDMFSGISPWLGRVPGRLLHVNVFGSAIFAAVSGSSAATAATVGKVSVPELMRRGYPTDMVVGSLAGAATLGLLIPPSIIMIVYAVATEQSISRMFIAGILPALLLVGLLAGYIAVYALVYPDRIPDEKITAGLREKIVASRHLIPIFLLIGGVIGLIYTGVASPTDAAATGVILSLILAKLTGPFGWKDFTGALMAATKTSAMISFILLGAAFLTMAMGFTGLPRDLATWIGSFDMPVWMLLVILTLFYTILGCFLDGISVVVLTTSIIMPMVSAAGIDPIWFGIYLVLVVEMSQITPPVGFNLFVLQGLTGFDILRIAKAAIPYFLLMMLAVVIIAVFPQIVTYLPNAMD